MASVHQRFPDTVIQPKLRGWADTVCGKRCAPLPPMPTREPAAGKPRPLSGSDPLGRPGGLAWSRPCPLVQCKSVATATIAARAGSTAAYGWARRKARTESGEELLRLRLVGFQLRRLLSCEQRANM